MKQKLLPFTLFLLLSGGGASAEVNVNALAADLQSQGFTRIEMRETPNQLKVEAIRGTEKVETIYDKSTGAVLKSETERVGAFEDNTPGVTLRQRNRDFVRATEGQSSDDGSTDDSSSDDDSQSSGSDDGPNHDVGDDHGSDDSGDDNGGDNSSGGSSGAGSHDGGADDHGGDSGSDHGDSGGDSDGGSGGSDHSGSGGGGEGADD